MNYEIAIIIGDLAILALALALFIPALKNWRAGKRDDDTKKQMIGSGAMVLATALFFILAITT